MKEYVQRSYEVFIVSGRAQNCARTLRSLFDTHPDLGIEQVHVYAAWEHDLIDKSFWGRFVYHRQDVPFVITKENNKALLDIWGRGYDAVLLEDDVEVISKDCYKYMSIYAEAYGGRCVLSPGIIGYNYENVTTRPNPNLRIHLEPKHFPFINIYFPVEVALLVGLYDEAIDTYGCDDNDYSLRCQKAGVLQLACPQLLVEHKYDRSVFAARGKDQEKSREYFKRKWGHYPGA